MGKEQTLEELRKAERAEIEKFKFRMDGISHAKPTVIKFVWRNKIIDLRTVSDRVALEIAKDDYCGVLTLTKKGQAMTSENEATGKPGK